VKVLLVLAAVVAAAVGVAAPWAAPRVAALLLVVVASAYVASQLQVITSNLPLSDDRLLRAAPPPRAGTPADLTVLTNELRLARPNRVLSPAVAECLRDLAAARLEDRHGLDVRDPFTHSAIEGLVSEQLWAVLVRPLSANYRAGTRLAPRPRYRSLPALIDEVERL
jgi:hypothetical protein